MDALYSLTLLAALALGAVGALVAMAGVAWGRARAARRRLVRVSVVSGVGAMGLGLVSALVHAAFGHGPGSLEPMTARVFLANHGAYRLVGLLALGSLAGSAVVARARGPREPR